MSRARRLRRQHLQPPMPEQPIPDMNGPGLRSFAELPTGIMDELTQPVVENLTASEVRSRCETVTGISLSETPSQHKSEPKPRWLPHLQCTGTPCCGLHVIHGIQAPKFEGMIHRYPTPEEYILGIQQAYKNQQENSRKVMDQRETYAREHARQTDKEGKEIPFHPPHEGFRHEPGKIAGMLVFVWNTTDFTPTAKALSDYITEHKLGECFFTGEAFNPNSARTITAMTWCVEGSAYYKFIADHTKPEPKDDIPL